MGGKALKAFGVSRIPAKKYFILKTELLFLANKYQIYPEVPLRGQFRADGLFLSWNALKTYLGQIP